VTLAVGQRDDQARFEVIDHGRGIEASELERIFARFHQVDKSDARRAGGWGLGLAIAKAIVDEHRGRIWVESEVGRGATFIFEVPVAPPETA
jgi:signal transduction histidine kinase